MIDIERFWDGDPRYFSELIRDYGPLVLKICASFGRSQDHVEDLFQEIWAKVFERRRSFQGSGSFGAWLCRVASNQCINDYRARQTRRTALEKSRETVVSMELTWQSADAEVEVERGDLQKRLLAAVQKLPEREKEAICLRILGDRSPDEVARIMGIDQTTVRSNISRGIQRLRERIREWDP